VPHVPGSILAAEGVGFQILNSLSALPGGPSERGGLEQHCNMQQLPSGGSFLAGDLAHSAMGTAAKEEQQQQQWQRGQKQQEQQQHQHQQHAPLPSPAFAMHMVIGIALSLALLYVALSI